MHITRRKFLSACAAAGAGAFGAGAFGSAAERVATRRFHACSNTAALDADPELLNIFEHAGIDVVWLAGFFYGYWPYPPEELAAWRERIHARGLGCEIVNIPLGHPGDSLGAPGDAVPLTPPERWRMAQRPDGSAYSGTSLHAPATEENAAAMRRLQELGVRQVFLDDDFRLAVGPGVIGGCFCDEHRGRFLDVGGYTAAQWEELLADVQGRSLSPILRAWVEFTCDELTGSFRAQQAAAPEIEVGNMVMYLGAEKAGIRLKDYAGVPLRVGELMFNDASFGAVKNKTDELFSCLFHRRYVTPDLAYSETTAYPADQLSAANMAAKLAVSTIADVRNTMYMSGLTPIPNGHWDVLAPAMKKHAAIHRQLAGHTPRGPFKLYWGEASRYVGDDKPYSLFLGTGVPFEVVDEPGADGWTFLSEWDARDAASGKLRTRGTRFIARSERANTRGVDETVEPLYALKHELADALRAVPHIEEDVPVVCAWYPTAGKVLLWNLAETETTITLRVNGARNRVTIAALNIELVTLDATTG
jgi:hypothetical protein